MRQSVDSLSPPGVALEVAVDPCDAVGQVDVGSVRRDHGHVGVAGRAAQRVAGGAVALRGLAVVAGSRETPGGAGLLGDVAGRVVAVERALHESLLGKLGLGADAVAKTEPSPFAPESDEERAGDAPKPDAPKL